MSKAKTKQQLLEEIERLKSRIAELEAGSGEPAARNRDLEAQERYRALFSDVDFPVICLNREGVVLDGNAAAAKMFGLTPEEGIGKSIYDYFPNDRDVIDERINSIFDTAEPQRYEFYFSFDIGQRWLSSYYLPVRDDQGDVCCVMIASHDITGHHMLREQEALLSWVVSQTSEAVALLDLEGRIKFVNQAAADMHGYKISEMLEEHVSIFHTDEQMVGVERLMEQAAKEDGFVGEVWHKHRDGTVFPTMMRNKILRNEEGEPTWMIGTARNLTQERESERRQRELSSIIEQSSEGIALVDSEGSIEFINDAFARMHGYTVDELIGKNLELFHNEDQLEAVRAANKQILTTGQFSGEVWHVHRDGTVFPTIMHNFLLRDHNNEPVGMVGTARDITERKRAEDRAHFLGQVTEQVTDSIVTTDLAYRITYVNKAFKELYGYSSDEVIGQSPDILNASTDAEDIQGEIYDSISNGRVWRGEVENRRKDGSTFLCELTVHPLKDDSGSIIAYAASQRDISELKRAQEQETVLSSIVRQSPEGVALVDMDAKVQYINDSFARMHGYTAEEVQGKHIEVFHTKEQLADVMASIEKLRATGKFVGELWHKHRDGRVFPTIMHHSMLVDDAGKPYGMVGAARDITSQKLAEAELRESHEKYRLLIDNIGCPIMLFDLNGVLLLINDEGAKNLGAKPSEIIGKGMKDIVPANSDLYLERIVRITNTGKGEEFADELDTPNGRRWFLSNMQPARKTDGTFYGVQIVTRDVTELKRNEESLREMAEELEAERKSLHEKNIALTQVLDHMESQKKDWAAKLQASLEQAIRPLVDQLAKEAGSEREPDFDELRATLQAILASDGNDFARRYETLTGREIELAGLISKGKASKEIADEINLSLLTVLKHREKIRKKLGLTGKKIDLGAYLRRHLK